MDNFQPCHMLENCLIEKKVGQSGMSMVDKGYTLTTIGSTAISPLEYSFMIYLINLAKIILEATYVTY